jgi:hypothetical protein
MAVILRKPRSSCDESRPRSLRLHQQMNPEPRPRRDRQGAFSPMGRRRRLCEIRRERDSSLPRGAESRLPKLRLVRHPILAHALDDYCSGRMKSSSPALFVHSKGGGRTSLPISESLCDSPGSYGPQPTTRL